MAKKSKKKLKNNKQAEVPVTSPWISMRSGLIVITITSIAMAVLTAWQSIPSKGVTLGIMWGLIFGGLIWVIFWGMYFINRKLH